MKRKSKQISFRPAWNSAKPATDTELRNLYL